MIIRRVLIGAAGVALAWGVAGCGEKTEVTVYEQGKYQGKPDTQPWDSQYFKGDRVVWETVVKKRNEGQSESSRITPTPR